MRKKKLVIILVSAFVFLMLIGGSSYAYFVYNKDISNVSLETGDISLSFSNSNNVTLTNLLPMTDEMGKVNGTYIDFTVSGTVDTDRIYYEVYLVPKDNTTMTSDNIDNYVKTYLTDQSDVKINDVKLYKNLRDSTKGSGKIIYQAIIEPNTNGTTKSENKDFRLRLWLKEDYVSTNSEAFNFNVYLYAINVDEDFEIEPYADGKVRKAITEKINAETGACNPIWVDDMDTPEDTTDDITYFSGTNECVDMNYVWYSGKLWRITAIYPDGTMKMITEDALTAIYWGSTVEYNGSWAYQWVNEDFYDTLVNPNDILVSNSTWNYSEDGNDTPVRPESIATQKMVTAPVGLLNAYEYYNTYRNASISTNYLSIFYNWWLITQSSSTYIKYVDQNSNLSRNVPWQNQYGVRPSIYLKNILEFSGDGTITNPYKIVGDKDSSSSDALISSRSVGEYVKFDNDIYRIVSIDEALGTTKLTRANFLRNSENIIKKNFASTVYFGRSTNSQIDDYWDYYLNNTWYNSISGIYKNMLVDDTYYLGLYTENTNYKQTICEDAMLNNVTTKNCAKYTSSDVDKIFVGKVGLLRAGEMFSSQFAKGGYWYANDMWTITPFSSLYVNILSNIMTNNHYPPSSYTFAVRPSITLKAGIKITGGTGYVGGDTDSPFEISE